MKTLTYIQPHDLAKLLDELLAVPSLAPSVDSAGRRWAVLQVEGDGEVVTLTVPDDADEGSITAVVETHDPTPRPEPPSLEDRLAALEAESRGMRLEELPTELVATQAEASRLAAERIAELETRVAALESAKGITPEEMD